MLSCIGIAINKAYTAARERQPTRELGAAERESGWPMAYYADAKYTGFGGGVPVIIHGVTVGAVAISGLTEEEDEEIASLGVAAILARETKLSA